MGNEIDLLALLALGTSALVGGLVAHHIARRLGRALNFRSMLLINYILVNQVSGIVHLSQIQGASRGYFDATAVTDPAILETAIVSSTVGLVLLCVASLHGLPLPPDRGLTEPTAPWTLPTERRAAWTLSAVLAPLTLFSMLQIQQYVSDLDATRVISVAEGYARYSFISGWFVWVVALATIAAVSGKAGTSKLFVLVVAGAAMIAIVTSLAWSGGRSVIIVMALPLLLVLLPKLDGLKWLALPTAVAAATSYILSVTETRSIGSGSQLATWLDWEWGRFSLMGFAKQHVDAHGYLLGETFFAGILNVLFGAFRLIGIGIPNPPLRMSMNITGAELLNSSTAIHIVPGLNAELYMNFGILGVAVGYYFLGRLANWTDSKFVSSEGAILKLLYAYIGTLIVFRTISADSGSIYSYLLYTGFPLLAIAFVSRQWRKRAALRASQQGRQKGTVSPGQALRISSAEMSHHKK